MLIDLEPQTALLVIGILEQERREFLHRIESLYSV
jgi:hypothetical protein